MGAVSRWKRLRLPPPSFGQGQAPSAAHSGPPILLAVPSEPPQESQGTMSLVFIAPPAYSFMWLRQNKLCSVTQQIHANRANILLRAGEDNRSAVRGCRSAANRKYLFRIICDHLSDTQVLTSCTKTQRVHGSVD